MNTSRNVQTDKMAVPLIGLPTPIVAIILSLSILPLVLATVFGISFASKIMPFNLGAEESNLIVHGFESLSGVFSHALLDWTACILAFVTCALAFTHYRVKRDSIMPVIGVALLSSGFLDAFHVLVGTQLVESTAPYNNLLPFTWALGRLFNSFLISAGILIAILSKKKSLVFINSFQIGRAHV